MKINVPLLVSGLLLSASPSLYAVITLDFVNASFVDNTGTGGVMRWSNVGSEGGTDLDLIATVATGSTYTPGTQGPGNAIGPATGVPAGLTRIKVLQGTDVTFDFRLVATGTSTAVDVSGFAVSFWDFDSNNNSVPPLVETVTLLDVSSEAGADTGSYTYATATGFAINALNPYQPAFVSTQHGNKGDNPTDLSNLTTDQEQKVVQLNFFNSSGFSVNLDVSDAGRSASRTFFLGGDVPFSVPTTTVAIPEPATLGFVFFGATGLVLRRRR